MTMVVGQDARRPRGRRPGRPGPGGEEETVVRNPTSAAHAPKGRGGTRGGNGRSVTRWILVLLWALGAASPAFGADEIHWTIMGQTAVTFDWRETSADAGDHTIRYGTAPGVYTGSVTAVTPSPRPDSCFLCNYWEARLTGLQEDTLYYYQIASEPESTFRTPPLRGSSGYWIAEEADVGSTFPGAYPLVGPTQVQIAADHPDLPGDDRPRFVLVPGDLTYGDDKGQGSVDQHFNDVMVWSRWAAYMPAWGNHEDGSLVDDRQNYEGRFDLPNSQESPNAPPAGGPGEEWSWFDYGNVRFISYPEPFTGAWTDWKTKVDPIMAAAQADPAITFIVTFGHRPAYSSGADHQSNTTLAGHLRDLRAKYRKYVLNLGAHSHHYERSNPALTNDLVHIVGAGGGATVGGLLLTQPAWSLYRINHLAFLKLHITADRIEGFAICGPDGADATDSCTPGTVIDQWSIEAPRPPDTTPPSTTATPVPAPTAEGWNNTAVTVTLDAAENTGESGVKEIHFSLTGAESGGGVVSGDLASVQVSAEGITALTFFARDNAGNQEEPQTLTLKIDTTPPILAVTRNPAPNIAGWNNTDVYVTFSATDSLSGIHTVSAPVVITTEGAGQMVSGSATDRAGNTVTISTALNIDKTPPSILGLPRADCVLWPPNQRLVEVASVTAHDGLSGVTPGSLTILVTSNEPSNARRDNEGAQDIIVTGGIVQLRADRSGSGTGRIYTLTASASDLAGNSTTTTTNCKVPHDQRNRRQGS